MRVSIDGGSQVRWNPNGRELFYIAADDQLMAVSIRFSSDNKTVEPGTPVKLFDTNVDSTGNLKYRQQYAVSPDGKSFVMHSSRGRSEHLADHGHPQLEAEPLALPVRKHVLFKRQRSDPEAQSNGDQCCSVPITLS